MSLYSRRDLKQLIKEFDSDGSGEIEFEEFAAMVANFVVAGEDNDGLEEELREAFRLYDKEGNGYINVSDLREILRALDDNITEDELDEMIAEIDTDGSGTVDFEGKGLLEDWRAEIEENVFRVYGDDVWGIEHCV